MSRQAIARSNAIALFAVVAAKKDEVVEARSKPRSRYTKRFLQALVLLSLFVSWRMSCGNWERCSLFWKIVPYQRTLLLKAVL